MPQKVLYSTVSIWGPSLLWWLLLTAAYYCAKLRVTRNWIEFFFSAGGQRSASCETEGSNMAGLAPQVEIDMDAGTIETPPAESESTHVSPA